MAETKLKNSQLPTTISSKTVDNTNDINTTTTRLKITGGSNGQVLSTDGAGNISWTTAGGGGGATIQVDEYSSSGTYTKPAWAKTISVYLVGGGGGGGGGARFSTATIRSGGSGGGSAAIAWGEFVASQIPNSPTTVTITIGAGGTGGTPNGIDNRVGNNGVAGGFSAFGTYIRANGGGAGLGGTSSSSVTGGSAGSGSNFVTNINGMAGGQGDVNAGSGNNASAVSTRSGGGGTGNQAGTTTTKSGTAGAGFPATNTYLNNALLTGGAGGTDGGNGSNGTNSVSILNLTIGTGGGGGGYKTGQATGNGGNGGNYGAGGGGGAASDNGFAAGTGGNGSGGYCVIITKG